MHEVVIRKGEQKLRATTSRKPHLGENRMNLAVSKPTLILQGNTNSFHYEQAFTKR